ERASVPPDLIERQRRMWCWPWHAPNRNLVAGLMKSLFRLFAVSCTYCSATIGALTPVNNARLFGLGPQWAKRSEDFSGVPKLKSGSDCDCVRTEFVSRAGPERWPARFFSATRRKTLEPMASPGLILGCGNVVRR